MGFLDKILPNLSTTGVVANSSQNVSRKNVINTNKISMSPATGEDELQAMDFSDETGLERVVGLATNKKSKDINLSELYAKKENALSTLNGAKSNLANIQAGNSENLKNLSALVDEAYNKYQSALSNDVQANPELGRLQEEENTKTVELESAKTNLSQKEGQISSKEAEITAQKTSISAFKGELNVLKSQLSSIPKNSTKEGSEESNRALDEKREKINHLIALKQEEIKLAEDKLKRQEEEKTNLEKEKSELENNKQQLENEISDIQKQIQETASKATIDAQNAYNQAKKNFDSAKAKEIQAANKTVATAQKNLSGIEAKISEAKAEQYKKDNYEVQADEVTNIATQFEGLTNDEMKNIMTKDGAKFDDGFWCADFVTYTMTKAYGKDNTPDDFLNTCEMYSACRGIKQWGEEKGRNTLNSDELNSGDAIIINVPGGSMHIGLVISVNEDGTVNTIEGNTSDDNDVYQNNGQVARKIRKPESVNTYVKLQK